MITTVLCNNIYDDISIMEDTSGNARNNEYEKLKMAPKLFVYKVCKYNDFNIQFTHTHTHHDTYIGNCSLVSVRLSSNNYYLLMKYYYCAERGKRAAYRLKTNYNTDCEK